MRDDFNRDDNTDLGESWSLEPTAFERLHDAWIDLLCALGVYWCLERLNDGILWIARKIYR